VRSLCQRGNGLQSLIGDINFGECQIIRECVLSERLCILKVLKQHLGDALDLNAESGYCLRWAARKGLRAFIEWLLHGQKEQRIDISFFQYQAIEWAVLYAHRAIAILLQKYYVAEKEMGSRWSRIAGNGNGHGQSQQTNVNGSGLGEFDIFSLPSLYQDIIEKIISCEDEATTRENVAVLERYYANGCDLRFENLMAWTVAVDCSNVAVLSLLHSKVGVDALVLDGYLLRMACEIRSIEMVQFAKTIIRWRDWEREVVPHLKEYRALCDEETLFVQELEDYHGSTHHSPEKERSKNKSQFEMPQSPIPWPYEHAHVKQKYGIVTRSVRKQLVKKGVLQDLR